MLAKRPVRHVFGHKMAADDVLTRYGTAVPLYDKMPSMEITFLGGADEVGASSILIEIADRRLLIDAGIRPTPKARWGLAGDQLPDLSLIEQGGGLDAILVTHAHTDHTGALELVLERYPDVPVYATPVTLELTRVLHADARRIMQMRLEEEGELPLFDEVATNRLLNAFRPVEFNQPLTLAPGLTATYFLAGHIAGAAMIGLASAEGRILISGDISIDPQRTVDGARPPAFSPDVLILESTYGGRLHANRLAEERRLVETVAEVVEAGGKVLIPAFALGRAQEVLLTLGEYQRRGELAPVPVWADGMVRAICQAYSHFPDALPLPLQEQGAQFYTEHIRPIQSAAQRNALIWESAPAIIVSSSGMLAGGPSMAYARALAARPENAILLTGYQDEEAPGRRLQEVARRGYGALRLGDKKVDVKCRLGTYSLSAHADTGQLVSFVEALDPTQIYLVHGDEDATAGPCLHGSLLAQLVFAAEPSFTWRMEPPALPSLPNAYLGRLSSPGYARRSRRFRFAAQRTPHPASRTHAGPPTSAKVHHGHGYFICFSSFFVLLVKGDALGELANYPGLKVAVRGDGASSFQSIAEVLQVVRSSGVQQMGIAAKPADGRFRR